MSERQERDAKKIFAESKVYISASDDVNVQQSNLHPTVIT